MLYMGNIDCLCELDVLKTIEYVVRDEIDEIDELDELGIMVSDEFDENDEIDYITDEMVEV